jgi:DNA-binding PadR family transcriptional regulator
VALADAILACLTERPMTGYELAKTFDSSIGFFWKADHQQIYRELSRLRDRGHIQGREVVQSGKPNKLVYTLTAAGRDIGRPAPRSRPRSRTICWSGFMRSTASISSRCAPT